MLELRGIACIPIDTAHADKKGIMTSRSFGRTVGTLEELKEALALYTSRAAEKLRTQHSEAQVMTVFVATNPFQEHAPQYTKSTTIELPRATNFTPELVEYAQKALARIYKSGYRYHKAGVYLTNFTPEATKQLSFFTDMGTIHKQRELMHTVDVLNTRFGRDTVQIASVGEKHTWRMRQAHRSPSYTTKVKDFPIAVI